MRLPFQTSSLWTFIGCGMRGYNCLPIIQSWMCTVYGGWAIPMCTREVLLCVLCLVVPPAGSCWWSWVYSVLCYLLTSLHLNKAKQIDITLFPLNSSFNKGSYQMIGIFCVFESEFIEMVTIQGWGYFIFDQDAWSCSDKLPHCLQCQMSTSCHWVLGQEQCRSPQSYQVNKSIFISNV